MPPAKLRFWGLQRAGPGFSPLKYFPAEESTEQKGSRPEKMRTGFAPQNPWFAVGIACACGAGSATGFVQGRRQDPVVPPWFAARPMGKIPNRILLTKQKLDMALVRAGEMVSTEGTKGLRLCCCATPHPDSGVPKPPTPANTRSSPPSPRALMKSSDPKEGVGGEWLSVAPVCGR